MKKDQNIAIYFSNSINHINFNASPFTSFFNTSSEKGAIRHEIYKMGYPYQSYFIILQKRESDKSSGSLYSLMLFNAWKSETGQTPYLCYSKKVTEDEYKVDCGTAP